MSAVDDARQMVLMSDVPSGPPAALSGPAPGGGITFSDVWRIVKQRKLLIILTFAVLYALVLGATFVVWRFFPLYSSEAYIRLNPPAEDWDKMQRAILPKEYIMNELTTEANQIKNRGFLAQVLAQPEIKQTNFYTWYGDDFGQCLDDLEDMLGVAPVRDTYLIRVALAVRTPGEARRFVNTIVSRYVDRSQSEGTDEGRERLNILKNTQANVQQQLQDVRERIRASRSQRDMPALESEREMLTQVISVLNTTRAELQTRRADVEAQLSSVRGVDPRNLPLTAEMRVVIESDPVLRFYRQQAETVNLDIEAARRSVLGENHRQMLQLKERRDGYFRQEARRREELITDLRGRQVESLEQERARITNMLSNVLEQLSEREAVQRDLDKSLQEFDSLLKDEQRLDRELERVSMSVREAESQVNVQNQRGMGRLQALTAERDPVWPTRPNIVLYIAGGGVLAALIAVGLAFLREFTDQALRTPIDIARHGHLSVLGCVPLLDDEQAEIETIENATRAAPQSLVAESFRQIRTQLTFSGPRESQHALLVTSPRPDEGKTSIAINLAVTLAQGNQRTLLIDCNFRRPAIGKAFQCKRAEGLSNVLVGHNQFAQVISRTDLPNLDVLASGPMPPNPGELLSSNAMRDLVAAAKKQYDRVVLDGPPVLLVSDALVLATLVDGVVLVARTVGSTKGALRRARELLQRVNARIIGAVLNGAEARPGGYFRQQYREFYEYASEEVVPRELPGGSAPEIESGDDDEKNDKK